MRHTIPWSVKGVDHDAREAAKEAARRSGMSLGEWLNTVIAGQAAEAELQGAGLPAETRRLETMTERLDAANRRELDTAIPHRRIDRDGSSDIVRALDAVARLAEISERRSAAAMEAVEQFAVARGLVGPRPEQQPAAPILPLAARAADSSTQAQLDEIARSIRAMNAGITGPQASHAAEPAAERPKVAQARLFDQDLDATLAEIAARQRALDHDAPAAAAPAAQPAPPPVHLDTAAEAPLQPGLAPLAERLDALGRRMDQILNEPLPRDAEPDRSGIAAELKRLSERIDEVNKPQGDALERELKTLSGRIEAMRREIAERETAQTEKAVAELRADIAQIAARLGDLAPRRAVETLEAEIHALGDRVANVQAKGIPADSLAQLVADFERTVTGLTPAEGFADELRALSRKLDQVKARGGSDEVSLDRLTDEILSVRELVAGAATREAVEALSDQVAVLAERLEAMAPPANHAEAITAAIEARIEDIASRLEKASRRPGPAVAAIANPQLEEALRRLADKLDESHSHSHDPKVLAEIEKHVLALAAKIDAADARFGQLGTIERGLSDLFVQMEEMRASTLDAAERAARDAVADLNKAGPEAEAAVEALKSDIDALRHAQVASEDRTVGSLDAVHQTLERVLRRIAEIDPSARASGKAETETQTVKITPAPQPASRPIVPPPAPAAVQPPAPTAPNQTQLQAGASAPKAVRGPAPKPAEAPAAAGIDLPLEPGSGAPRLRAPAPGATPMGGSKADFIAAARRAAQAASEASLSAPASADDKPASLFARMRGAFARGKAEPAETPAPAPALAPAINSLRAVRTTPPAADPLPAAVAALTTERDAPVADEAGAGSRLASSRRTIVIGIAAALLVVAAGVSTWQNLRLRAPDTAGTVAPNLAAPQSPADGNAAPASAPAAHEQAPADAAPAAVTPASGDAPATSPAEPAAPPAPPAPPREDTGAPATTGSIASPARVGLPGTSVSSSGWQAVGRAGERPATIPAALKSAAEGGNPAAAFELGTRYLEGRGVQVSAAEAASWYQRAADAGLAPAQYRLGSLYEKGTGVTRDLNRARGLYEKAAAAGNGKAMHNLAVMFAQGALSERPDYRTAAQWFRRAAEHGVTDSQFNLGILYARGLGVDQSLAESYKWFALAALGGDQDAGKKRDEVAGRLDQQTMVAARLAVETFQVKAEPEAAVRVAMPAGGWGDEPRAAPTPPPPHRPVRPVSSR